MESEVRKITVHIPADLLEAAQEQTGQGITETVRQGLELLKRERAYKRLLAARGTIRFEMTADEIRGDD